MEDFAWVPADPRRRRFPSPLLTELLPAPSITGAGAGESPLITGIPPFDRSVLSWNGDGRWLLEMRLRLAGPSGGSLTPYYVLGVLDGALGRSASSTEAPRAISPPVALLVDTLVVKNGAVATGFQVRATGAGNLRGLAVAHYRREDRRYTEGPAVPGAWGTALPVPERAQRNVEEPEIGGEVCSPTSLGMVLEYHGSPYRTLDVARAVYDPETRLYGNWPCNTGAAARLLKGGGWSAVVKMTGFDGLEREIAARRPVVLSHRWERGDLRGAPVSRSNGHLIVVTGFTKDGDLLVNDPAARPGETRRVYLRRELFRTWQERGEGIAYLLHPLGR
ncbi:MAG: C39 family peptidase [Cytophagales bacterium]|nr:C39 family peptidase [Armatimonadota bacterium]